MQSKIASDQKDHKLEFNKINCDYYREKKIREKRRFKELLLVTTAAIWKGQNNFVDLWIGPRKGKMLVRWKFLSWVSLGRHVGTL